jgi:hypothetical protein
MPIAKPLQAAAPAGIKRVQLVPAQAQLQQFEFRRRHTDFLESVRENDSATFHADAAGCLRSALGAVRHTTLKA